MNRPYNNFKEKRLGRRVDFDGKFGYQCVDLFKQYIKEITGIVLGRTGNANEIWENKRYRADKSWKRINGLNNLMQGDIIVSIRGQYGHIGIVDRVVNGFVHVLDQNGSNNSETDGTDGDEITIHKYPLVGAFFAGVWRNERIIQNRKLEMKYIEQKRKAIEKEGGRLDQNTIDYANSTIYKK